MVELSLWYLSGTAQLVFWDKVSHWTGTYQVGYAAWLVTGRDSPISASPVLGLQVLTTMPSSFKHGLWGSTSGYHCCVANTSPSELTTQPQLRFCFSSVKLLTNPVREWPKKAYGIVHIEHKVGQRQQKGLEVLKGVIHASLPERFTPHPPHRIDLPMAPVIICICNQPVFSYSMPLRWSVCSPSTDPLTHFCSQVLPNGLVQWLTHSR